MLEEPVKGDGVVSRPDDVGPEEEVGHQEGEGPEHGVAQLGEQHHATQVLERLFAAHQLVEVHEVAKS